LIITEADTRALELESAYALERVRAPAHAACGI
jgi:hypothetical protein